MRPTRVALAGLAFVLLLAVGGPSAAQSATDQSTTRLTLVSQTSWVGPGGRFRVQVRAESVPTGASIQMAFYKGVTTRDALDEAADGRPQGGPIYTAPSTPVAATTMPDGTIVTEFDTSIAGFQSTGGVYPVEVRITGPTGDEPVGRLFTTMVRLAAPTGSSGAPLSVGVVVPLQGLTEPGIDGAPVLPDQSASELAGLIDAVAAQPQVPVTLAASAESLLLLQERDDDGSAAIEKLKVAAAHTQVLGGPYAPIDTGAWTESDLQTEMDHQYQVGPATLTDILGEATSPLAVLDRTVTPDALAHLQDLGTTAVVTPSGQLAPLSTGSTSTYAQQFRIATGNDRSVPAVVADDAAGNRLRRGRDPVVAAHMALAELAYVDQAQGNTTGRGVAVIVPADVDPLTLTTFLGALTDPTGAASGVAGAPAVAATELDGLFTATAPTGDRTTERGYEADPPSDLGSYPDDLRGAGRSYTGLLSLTPEAEELHVPVDRLLLSSGARSLDDHERSAMLGAATGTMQATTAEIVVTPEQVVTLTSSSGNVPLNLENRLLVPAEVRIQLASDKLDFPEGAVIQETLPAALTTTIELPVETRATGAFPLTVTITSADGALPVATTRYTVRSTAISGVGLVLSIGAGLFLLVWWGRHWRTSRRARTLVASNHPALSGAEPDGYAPPDTDPLEGR